MVLANYIKSFERGVIDSENSPLLSKYSKMFIDYGDINGCGRIKETSGTAQAPDTLDRGFVLMWCAKVIMSTEGLFCLKRISAKTNKNL